MTRAGCFPILGQKSFRIPWTIRDRSRRSPARILVVSCHDRGTHIVESFLYARVGNQDAFAFPELVPGSVVRVDPLRSAIEQTPHPTEGDDLSICRTPRWIVRRPRKLARRDRILLHTRPSLLFESLEFKLHSEAVILGRVDAEIRPIRDLQPPPGHSSARSTHIGSFPRVLGPTPSLGELLRYSRERVGLNFRRARELSQQIAIELNDSRISDFSWSSMRR